MRRVFHREGVLKPELEVKHVAPPLPKWVCFKHLAARRRRVTHVHNNSRLKEARGHNSFHDH